MYIVGFIDNNENEIIISLGTDGGKGTTSITTAYKTEMVNGKREKGSLISLDVYTAIPDGDSGAPQ